MRTVVTPEGGASTKPLRAILGARVVAARRGFVASLFPYLALGPILLAAVWAVLGRYLEIGRVALADFVARESAVGEGPGVLGLALALAVLAGLVPAARAELFALRPGAAFLEALPVTTRARFVAALGALVGPAALAAGGLALVLVALAGTIPGGTRLVALALLPLGAALALVPWALAVASVSVRLRLAGARLAAVIVGLPVALLALAGDGMAATVLAPLRPAAHLLDGAVAAALDVGSPVRRPAALGVDLAIVAAGIALSAFLAGRWRARDVETARRLVRPRSRRTRLLRLLGAAAPPPAPGNAGLQPGLRTPGNAGLQPGLRTDRPGWSLAFPGPEGRRLLPPATAALTARDLLLVARRASPVIPLAAAVAVLALAAVIGPLPEADLDSAVTLRLGVLGGVVAALAAAAVVPFLVAREVPRLWLERTTGVGLDDVIRAKVWTARLLGAAGAAAGIVALTLGPGFRADLPAADVVRGALQLALAAAIVASLVGAASFELPARPLLGLLFAAFVGLAPALLVVFVPRAWWAWAGLAVYVAGALAGRAPHRLRRLEVVETVR